MSFVHNKRRSFADVEVRCCLVEKRELALCIRQKQPLTKGKPERFVVMEVWIPRSQVSHFIAYGANREDPTVKDATLTMPEWLAEEKRLIYSEK